MAKKPVVKSTDEQTTTTEGSEDSVMKLTDPVADEIEETVPDESAQAMVEAAPKKKTSFSSKALSAIALLLIGGAAALYGGPKLAPLLPSGMEPVANFLAPGEVTASTKIQTVKDELSQRLAALENAEAPDVSAQLDTLSNDMDTRIAALSDQVAAADSQDIEARLTAAETQLSGLVAQIDSLNQNLAGVKSGDASAELAGYQSVIDGLKAEIAALSSKQGLIGQRIDEVSATTDRRVEQANETITDITRAKAIGDIEAALETGNSFADALAILSEGGVEVPTILSDSSEGVTTLTDLKASFSSAAHAGLKASIKGESSDSITGKLTGFLKSQVTVRSLEPQDGTSVDAVLSRIQAALDNDDLTEALSQAADLNGVSKAAMETWLSKANNRQAALDAVASLSAN